jgi:hypothetical protein
MVFPVGDNMVRCTQKFKKIVAVFGSKHPGQDKLGQIRVLYLCPFQLRGGEHAY